MIEIELPPIPYALAEVLVDYAQQLKKTKKGGVMPYGELQRRSSTRFALVGVGQQLDVILRALHVHKMPVGLTLLTMQKDPNARLDFDWSIYAPYGVANAKEAHAARVDAIEFDWASKVRFLQRNS